MTSSTICSAARVDHEAELISRAGLKDIGRVVEHYGVRIVRRASAGSCASFLVIAAERRFRRLRT
jgi:pantoate kinase